MAWDVDLHHAIISIHITHASIFQRLYVHYRLWCQRPAQSAQFHNTSLNYYHSAGQQTHVRERRRLDTNNMYLIFKRYILRTMKDAFLFQLKLKSFPLFVFMAWVISRGEIKWADRQTSNSVYQSIWTVKSQTLSLMRKKNMSEKSLSKLYPYRCVCALGGKYVSKNNSK